MTASSDPWTGLRAHTMARIALGRAGVSLPTVEWLRLAEAHALARDAVHTPLDVAALQAELRLQGFVTDTVASAAADRAVYLRRPDLGRRLSADSAAKLRSAGSMSDVQSGGRTGAQSGVSLAVVLADGLSARATQTHALPLLRALRAHLDAAGASIGRVVVATQARVALGDEIGEHLGADAVLVLIGERPGLSSPDSLGAYLTWAPRVGCSDAQRNCVSNIRPEGQPPAQAAARLAWLLAAARRLGATGVALKDASDRGDVSQLLSPGAGADSGADAPQAQRIGTEKR